MDHHPRNVTLIGMAGVGKSTVGVLLARVIGKEFIDVDLEIQKGEGERLQSVLDQHGGEAFLKIEEKYVLGLRPENAVISTGGSVVHSPRAMAHLKSLGSVILLEAPVEVLKARVHTANPRGLVMMGAPDFESLYEMRQPLYRRWADAVVTCEGCTHDQVVDSILKALHETR